MLSSTSPIRESKSLSTTSIFIGLILALTIGCAGNLEKHQPSLEEQWSNAEKLFQKQKYREAVPEFTLVTFNFPASDLADDAQFYLAECHYELNEYILATSEYERLINVFPESPMVREALFKIGYCYYLQSPEYDRDQTNTSRYMEAFQEFLDEYSGDPRTEQVIKWLDEGKAKLAQKKFEAGQLYYRMKEFKAAIEYFKLVDEMYFDTPFAAKARLRLADCHRRMRHWAEAEDVLRKELERTTDEETRRTIQERLEQVQGRNEQEEVPEI